MKQEQIPTLDSFGNKVSESTTKAVLGYKKLNDQATVQLNKLQWSGESVSKKRRTVLFKTLIRWAAKSKQASRQKETKVIRPLVNSFHPVRV
ncbi:hypothetical protein QKW52_04600 [Bacillus sonorensis]|nr:hypothetical protein [Bacillus sonorensis]